MAQITIWRGILGLSVLVSLAGCVETAGTTEAAGAGGTTRVRAGAEIEAPDVFQASESALWDGRPSLGGIWVASPDAVDPERVVMFNPATGKSVKGALFRRERENPGPRLQLSSDAAEALGVLAGMPTEIQVTALRKEEIVEDVPPDAPVMAEGEAEAPADPEAADPNAADPNAADPDAAAVAAAALEAVDAGTAAAVDGAEAAADTAAGAVEEAPKRKTWKEKRAEAKAAREAKKAAEAAAAAAAAGIVPEGGADSETATAETAGVEVIESAPLDARKPEVASAEAEAPATEKAAATETPAAAEPPVVEAGGAARTIQIASFSKEDNANRAVEALSKIGITARIQKVEKNGKAVWGVVATGDQAMLQKIKDAGFADAYFLK